MSDDDWNVLSWHRDLAAAMRAQNFQLALHFAQKILQAQPNNALAQEIAKVLKEKEELANESSSEEDDGGEEGDDAENGNGASAGEDGEGSGDGDEDDDDDDDESGAEETDEDEDTVGARHRQ